MLNICMSTDAWPHSVCLCILTLALFTARSRHVDRSCVRGTLRWLAENTHTLNCAILEVKHTQGHTIMANVYIVAIE